MLNEKIDSIIRAFGEPFFAVPSMWYVTEVMKNYGKYTLSGDGADELFGSYYTHRVALLQEKAKNKDCIKRYCDYLLSFWGDLGLQINAECGTVSDIQKADLLLKSKSSSSTKFSVRNQLATEALLYFPYGVLTYVDRLSMAHSLEARSPFLDQELWEYVMKLPDEFRLSTNSTKIILRKIALKYLPEDIVNRKKEGFVFPLYSYLCKHEKDVIAKIQRSKVIKKLRSEHGLEVDSGSLYKAIKKYGNSAYKEAQVLHSLHVIARWEELYL